MMIILCILLYFLVGLFISIQYMKYETNESVEEFDHDYWVATFLLSSAWFIPLFLLFLCFIKKIFKQPSIHYMLTRKRTLKRSSNDDDPTDEDVDNSLSRLGIDQ